ncbi:MAG: Swt1 family HEPN domain-containing protein [Deltaproteobacteria bacterium]|nr:Swt1 family HEPN domain-containing protein [Deltaproteobacteria bacterium]
MATTNRERVGKALDLLRDGLAPYAEREIRAKSRRVSIERIRRYNEDPRLAGKPISDWDVSGLLRLMTETWNEVFRDTLGHTGRSLVSELRDWRNKWAHQERLSSEDADRAMDSCERLLTAVSAPQATVVGRMKMELRRLVFDEQVRGEKRRAAARPAEVRESAGIRAWRDVVEPHDDVATGRYQQAEFAADLWQVHLGEGVAEYRDPEEFFRRTYLTESLKGLLATAVRRLGGQDGDPVVQLQTNFGGGKTHSMLALYHLFSGVSGDTIPEIEKVVGEAGVELAKQVRRVVLVGNRISPGNPVKKPDGTEVRTLWGELAYQLGGCAAFDVVRADDERATSPGDNLRGLLREFGPCVVLIDEWVSYARQLHDDPDLPAGTFETQFTFAQALSESVKLTDNCMLVVSLPASDLTDAIASGGVEIDDSEVGGIRGHDALERLRNVIARVESPWRPATADEGFEIVRRRLFKPLADQDAFKQRDITARAFADLYRRQDVEFPSACATMDYERRIQAAYPIHPEVFDRLYTDWSSLAKFQRTRGVLRLMAAVIHYLWESGDRSPLIQPWNIRLDDQRVQNELTRYLSDNWTPVIAKDVDGPDALPLTIDREAPNLGKLSAARRVARTIYLGSAPITQAAHRGIEDTRVKLGCVAPGEAPAVFGDALRRLAAQATYLYQDGARYWYGTQPTVTKLAEDRAEEFRRHPDQVAGELEKRLRDDCRQRGEFAGVHVLPDSPADVPDVLDARLVVLPSTAPYVRGEENPAVKLAERFLESRGSGPRMYRNTLVFLAADAARFKDLDEALRRYLAWDSIVAEVKKLNLDPHQAGQAEAQCEAARGAVVARIPETYQWLLVPDQEQPDAAVGWKMLRLAASGPLAERAGRRLLNDELLVVSLGPTVLRLHLDRVPLWRGEHVALRQLVEDFGQYVYLPRLKGPSVLERAVEDGVGLLTWEHDAFAFADSYDEAEERYRGLRFMQGVAVAAEGTGLVVKPGTAGAQIEREKPRETPSQSDQLGKEVRPHLTATVTPTQPELLKEAPSPRRFHATARLNPQRIGLEASQIADEVVSHLAGLMGTDVTVTLEIEARLAPGVPEHVQRTVTENSVTLGFDSHAFEEQ